MSNIPFMMMFLMELNVLIRGYYCTEDNFICFYVRIRIYSQYGVTDSSDEDICKKRGILDLFHLVILFRGRGKKSSCLYKKSIDDSILGFVCLSTNITIEEMMVLTGYFISPTNIILVK